ncbi:MAG: hypothetical protein KGJ80_11975 [Chloroflexota bacterium]|nr:hypothetical protein [Chloroflexota bacterium]
MAKRKKAPGTTARKRAPRRAVTGKAAANVGTATRKVLVIVHGAGSFPNDYYVPLVNQIETRLGRPFNYIPVYYADVTNPPATMMLKAAAPDSPELAQFKQKFIAAMQQSSDALPPAPKMMGIASGGAFGNVGGISLVEIIAKEVGDYLFAPSVSAQIQARLTAGLDQAAQQYDEIVLAALSLGTVVSFDVLRQSADHYPVAYFFSTGCPLAKLRRVGVRAADVGAISPATVAHWYNLYDTNDIVADALGPQFPNYRLHDIYVQVGNDPISAHDYFNNAASLDLLADAMR